MATYLHTYIHALTHLLYVYTGSPLLYVGGAHVEQTLIGQMDVA